MGEALLTSMFTAVLQGQPALVWILQGLSMVHKVWHQTTWGGNHA